MALVMGVGFGSQGLLPGALAETNPTYQDVPVWYLDGEGQGPPHFVWVVELSVAYNRDFDGWCTENHRTAAGNKFHHAHMVDGFPFLDTTREPNVWVTAEMCDWYWDNEYAVEDPPNLGWDRKSGSTATMEYNCHGFAFAGEEGPLLWIADNQAGQGKVIADDYTHIGYYEDIKGSVVSTTAHSYKVLDVSVMPKPPRLWDLERHKEEKRGSSAIYQFMDSPGYGLMRGWGNYYDKN